LVVGQIWGLMINPHNFSIFEKKKINKQLEMDMKIQISMMNPTNREFPPGKHQILMLFKRF
jgi:hypothetical protein